MSAGGEPDRRNLRRIDVQVGGVRSDPGEGGLGVVERLLERGLGAHRVAQHERVVAGGEVGERDRLSLSVRGHEVAAPGEDEHGRAGGGGGGLGAGLLDVAGEGGVVADGLGEERHATKSYGWTNLWRQGPTDAPVGASARYRSPSNATNGANSSIIPPIPLMVTVTVPGPSPAIEALPNARLRAPMPRPRGRSPRAGASSGSGLPRGRRCGRAPRWRRRGRRGGRRGSLPRVTRSPAGHEARRAPSPRPTGWSSQDASAPSRAARPCLWSRAS